MGDFTRSRACRSHRGAGFAVFVTATRIIAKVRAIKVLKMWALHHNTWAARIVEFIVLWLLLAFALAFFRMCDLRQRMSRIGRLLASSRCGDCQCFFIVRKEAVTGTVDIDEALALRQDISVCLPVRIVCSLGFGLVTLRGWPDDNDGYWGVLQTVLGDTPRK